MKWKRRIAEVLVDSQGWVRAVIVPDSVENKKKPVVYCCLGPLGTLGKSVDHVLPNAASFKKDVVAQTKARGYC